MRERVEVAIDRLGYRLPSAGRAMRGASFTIGLGLRLSPRYRSILVSDHIS